MPPIGLCHECNNRPSGPDTTSCSEQPGRGHVSVHFILLICFLILCFHKRLAICGGRRGKINLWSFAAASLLSAGAFWKPGRGREGCGCPSPLCGASQGLSAGLLRPTGGCKWKALVGGSVAPGLPSCGGGKQAAEPAGGETMALGSPLTPRLKGKRLGGEAQNGGGEKESVQGEKAHASLGGEKGRRGRAGRRGEETVA